MQRTTVPLQSPDSFLLLGRAGLVEGDACRITQNCSASVFIGIILHHTFSHARAFTERFQFPRFTCTQYQRVGKVVCKSRGLAARRRFLP